MWTKSLLVGANLWFCCHRHTEYFEPMPLIVCSFAIYHTVHCSKPSIYHIFKIILKLLNFLNVPSLIREQGWRSGESTRLSPMGPGFESQGQSPMWVEFVVGCLLAPRGFSLGTLVSPSPQKPTFPNSNSIWNGRRRTTLWMCYH